MDDVVRAFLENEQRLQLVRRLGRGGFGEVWEAESPSGVRSAIKVSLDVIDGANPAVQKELENLNLVKAFSGHPQIVGLLDYWLVTGFLVTRWELATDGTLLDVFEQYRREGEPGIPAKQLLKWLYEAANGLDFLHAKGIYHRDIKPQNLLLFHGHVKIGDLGLVKLAGASTASHTGSGTFGYLPPEAWEEHRLTSTTDLYSLAATYIKLRTGQEPFGTNPVEIVERQKRGEPILEGLEEREKAHLLAALQPDATRRFSEGCGEWVRGLWASLTQKSQPSRVTSKAPSPSAETPSTRSFARDSMEIVVGKGDVATLEEAVERCADGGVIRLPAGVYRLSRPLQITKAVQLLGDGIDATRVVCDEEGYVVKISGSKFTARGISFEHYGSQWADVAVIDSASVTIESCRFRGGVVDAENDRGGDGLWARGTTVGTVQGCVFIQNAGGIHIADISDLLLEGNTCEGNQQDGIAYSDKAGGTAQNNACRNNGYHGIAVHGQAQPTLEGNACEGNQQYGITYSDKARGTARNNVCRNNGYHGIAVQGQAQPTLEGNTCEGNQHSGIGYFENAGGTARNNVCRNNGYHGIGVHGQAQPTLEGNTCEENQQYGIAYSDKAGGAARNNVCRNNGQDQSWFGKSFNDQIWLGKGVNPVFTKNKGSITREKTAWEEFWQGLPPISVIIVGVILFIKSCSHS